MPSAHYLRISAPKEFTDALRTYCKASDMPISLLVRHAVREYWDRRAQPTAHVASGTWPYSAGSTAEAQEITTVGALPGGWGK